jgi:hypothetical protein
MTKQKTGGPAFPASSGWDSQGNWCRNYTDNEGMTLRDYFAAHAPITLTDAVEFLDTYGGEVTGPWPPQKVLRTLADLRVEYADAMLQARNVCNKL